ncbi:MAG: aminoglycoside phosphotransferase family protein, partial [Gammaproteobacteria bacterium]|nr:aminoglycoside phosphotransferase family protein [Gammaproteobacteria bacterium]
MTTNNSHDTVQIDAALVKRLIANQFPDWKNLPVTPIELSGWDNRTFHLGNTMSVRLPSANHYAAAVGKEQTWLPRIASCLPLPIPTPLAMGKPCDDYPWHWSVYGWLEGENATVEGIDDLSRFATALAEFLTALQRIDTTGAPCATKRSLRGGSLSIYDAQTHEAIDILHGTIDTDAATAIWEAALQAPFSSEPVWYHGDVGAGNLLVQHG